MIELLDLPDEMILAIMNKVKPQALLFCSIIGIGNDRLEQLALDKCHSVDLTFDNLYSPYNAVCERFYSYVLPRIYNNIQSISLNVKHLVHFGSILKVYGDEIVLNLTHLKITLSYIHKNTRTPITLGFHSDKPQRHFHLFSIVPDHFTLNDVIFDRFLLLIGCPSIMRSIVSIELGDNCLFKVRPSQEGLFFPQSPHLTHVRVGLFKFVDCVELLNQLGRQLHSLSVTVGHVPRSRNSTLRDVRAIFCPNLKQFTMTIYRNIILYEQHVLPLFQSLSAVEHLTLSLAIDVNRVRPNHFIDGSDLQRDIISHMPHLRQFNFHIRSLIKGASHIDIDTIRQSFIKQKQPVDCVLDYFNNNYSQCQMYSLPFIGTRLDFISNRFPLFDINNTFSNVTKLVLFDDIEPFENAFFERLTQALPHLRTLDVFNQLEQEEKTKITNLIEFSQLAALILHDIHVDYAEQFLCRSHLPCLQELIIRRAPLLTIIANNNKQARENCSKVELLHIVEPWIEPTPDHLNFFPLISVS